MCENRNALTIVCMFVSSIYSIYIYICLGGGSGAAAAAAAMQWHANAIPITAMTLELQTPMLNTVK